MGENRQIFPILSTALVLAILPTAAKAEAPEHYIGVFGGYELRSSDSWSSAPFGGKIGNDDGVIIGAKAGTSIADAKIGQLRAEAEVSYRRNDINSISTSQQGRLPAKGKNQAVSLMLNGYLDFDVGESKLVPFVGAGLGLARVKESYDVDIVFASILPQNFPNPVQGKGTTVSWQLMAGGALRLSEKVRLSVEGRYSQVPSLSISAGGTKFFETRRDSAALLLGINFNI